MLLSRYERMIARRYLLPGRSEAFIALVAGISMAAVMLGVAALVIVMSVMNGFRAELFDKIVGLNGHAVIQGYDGQMRDWRQVVADARATPGVTGATPMIEQPLMASFGGRVGAVLVRGMRVEDLRATPTLTQNVQVGSFATIRPGSGEVAIGSRLAQTLGASLGDEIQLISPQGPASPFGTVPRIVSYTVGAIFEVGVYDFDKAYVVMPLEDAQTLLIMGDSIGVVELEVSDPDRVEPILAPLARAVGRRGVVTDWRQMNASLFEALSVDRLVTTVVLSILILIATFNILSSLIMLVRAKTRDIAILRTMGATRGGMMRVFMSIGTAIGTLGIAAGLLLGFVVLAYRQAVVGFLGAVSGQQIWDPSMRFLTELPAKTDAVEVIGIAGMAFAMTVLATIYPAWRAASTDPVQVLRYD